MLYAILTGRPPFQADSVFETIEQVKGRAPKPPSGINRRVDRDLQTICLKCLEKDPARRYGSAEAVADDLERWFRGEPITAAPSSRWYRLRKFARRNRVALTTMVLVGSALIAGTIVSVWQAVRARRAEAAAVVQRAAATHQRDRARQAVDEMYTQVAQKWLAQQPKLDSVQLEFLIKALRYYQEFAQGPGTDPALRLEAARAYYRVGDIQGKLGRIEEAEAAYRRGLVILEVLVAADPDRLEYQLYLSNNCERLAGLLLQTGRLPQAEPLLQRTLALREGLVHRFPGDLSYLRGLAAGLNSFGVLLARTGRSREGEQALQRALPLRERLAALPSAEPADRRNLAGLCMNLGRFKALRGHHEAAVVDIRRAVDLFQALVDESPGNPTSRSDLVNALNNLGAELTALGQVGEAERAYRRANELAKGLADESPDVPLYRENLAKSHINLGSVLNETGHRREAEQSYQRALGLLERLSSESPRATAYRLDLAITSNNLGNVLQATNQFREAEQAYQRAVSIYEKLIAESPRGSDYPGPLANTYRNLAHLLALCPDPDFRDPRRAVELAKKSVELTPIDKLGESRAILGIAYYRAGQHDEAIAAIEKALDSAPEGDPAAGFFLAMAYWRKGEESRARDQFRKAKQWMETSKSKDVEWSLFRDEAATLIGPDHRPEGRNEEATPPKH